MASIKQQKNGKWRYRIRYKVNGKFKEISKSGFRTKRDAQSAANEIERQYNSGVQIGVNSIIFEDYVWEWLNSFKKPNIKASTYKRMERSIRLHIVPTFGMLRLNEITRLDIVKWVNSLSVDKKQKYGTIRSNLTILHDALETAVYELNYIEKNVSDKVKIPKNDEIKKLKFYTKEELTRLLSFLSTYKIKKYPISIQYFVLFSLLSSTGLRLGEALALEWSDISDDKLSVSKNAHYDDSNRVTITSPKTKSSIRTIKIDSNLINLLKRQKINKNECVLRYPNYHRPKNTNLIFSSEDGHYLRPTTIRDFFTSICKKADVPVLSPHALRHSHAVHLLESGASIKYVSSRLGHGTINITADIYMHITDKIEDDSLMLYEKYMNDEKAL